MFSFVYPFSKCQIGKGINPALPTARFLAFRAPALLHFDNETARDKRAQARTTPPYSPLHPLTPPHTPSQQQRIQRGWLNGISVNASFEWIFDCVVYDWIYFLPAREFFALPAEFRKSVLHLLYERNIFFLVLLFLLFNVAACYCCCQAPLKSRLVV